MSEFWLSWMIAGGMIGAVACLVIGAIRAIVLAEMWRRREERYKQLGNFNEPVTCSDCGATIYRLNDGYWMSNDARRYRCVHCYMREEQYNNEPGGKIHG